MKALDDTHTPDFFGLSASTAPPPPAPPLRIANYGELGEGFRERVARKVRRWTSKFRQLSGLEREAIMNALQGVQSEKAIEANKSKIQALGGIRSSGDDSPWPPHLMHLLKQAGGR